MIASPVAAALGVDTIQLRRMLALNESGAWGDDPRGDGTDAVVLRSTEQTVDGHWQIRDPARRALSKSERAATRLQVGDLVLTKSSGSSSHIGKTTLVTPEVAGLDAGFGNFMQRLRVTAEHDPRFVWYLLNHRIVRNQFNELSTTSTGLSNLNSRLIGLVELPLHGLRRQKAIADYLDRETAKIDTLIAKQERLIANLRERRAATIRTALLKGVDDGVALRSSGVEALGDIPVHWKVVPTRFLCSICTGDEDSGNASENGAYPFFVRGREVLRSDHYSFDCEAVMTPGDGQGGTGKVFHYFKGRFEAHQRVYVFSRFDGVSGRYFYYYVSTFLRDVALAGSNTVTMESLRRPLLASFPVAVPPVQEQRRITAHLDAMTVKIDDLIGRTEQFIDFSNERRAALITAAVTGQVDLVASA